MSMLIRTRRPQVVTVVQVSSVLMMMLIRSSNSAPQTATPVQGSLPDNDNEFICLLVPDDPQCMSKSNQPQTCACSGSGGGQCHCVPIDMCFDPPPKNNTPAVSPFDERIFVDIAGDRTLNSPCQEVDLLTVCCENVDKPTGKVLIERPRHECGIRNSNGVRITISGFENNQAQFGEFPWMVAVLTQSNVYVGGGSLVHPRVVLTAAHKVHDQSGNSLVTRIGDWNLNASTELIPSQAINVDKVLFHTNFQRPTLVNNVALLILQTDAILSDTVMPICLPDPGQVFDGSNCYVTGWGKDVFGATGRYQTIMKKVSVPAISNNQCQTMLRNTRLGPDFHLDSTFNCAGGEGEDACEGDGGSPLVCPNPNNPNEYVQMGVVAWGIGCGIVGNPGVYGSVPATVDWITETIQAEVGIHDFDVRG